MPSWSWARHIYTGFRHLGVCFHERGHLLRLQEIQILQLDRRRVTLAYRLGCATSPVWESHRAVCRGLLVQVCNLRPDDRALVFRGRAVLVRPAPHKEARRGRSSALKRFAEVSFSANRASSRLAFQQAMSGRTRNPPWVDAFVSSVLAVMLIYPRTTSC